MSIHAETRQLTLSTLKRMKQARQKIVCLTAYDATFAHVLDAAGVDVVLVGDSLGMVIQGHETTVPVTMDDVIYHTQCVARGHQRALLMADMPFMSCSTPEQALVNGARLLQEAGAQMVKLEGGTSQVSVVKRLIEQGIPVCAHLGLKPQFIHKLGGYRVQGRDEHSAKALLEDALALQAAGADVLLLECVPGMLAAEITANLDIPVIGIGAGVRCDGQILVLQDVLGITWHKAPRFTRNFMAQGGAIQDAVKRYVQAVRDESFPGPEHTF